ncbi:hypothetical protein [Calothrix sp. PCC 6303]|uniref:hypothetical protein n=1 Tax=Calothrix sp. PCC 6303 TaxID=1170562 RepID=UPI0002A00C2F|nr:hypothetical protein [Calothrix sp. PCC 6303]AFZ00480.1 hypothetical protein Cal6303_1429 [Calothrix sp. PCC 6303]
MSVTKTVTRILCDANAYIFICSYASHITLKVVDFFATAFYFQGVVDFSKNLVTKTVTGQ